MLSLRLTTPKSAVTEPDLDDDVDSESECSVGKGATGDAGADVCGLRVPISPGRATKLPCMCLATFRAWIGKAYFGGRNCNILHLLGMVIVYDAARKPFPVVVAVAGVTEAAILFVEVVYVEPEEEQKELNVDKVSGVTSKV